MELTRMWQLAPAKRRDRGKERERETLIQKALSNPSSDILLLSAIGPTDEPWYGVGGAHTQG